MDFFFFLKEGFLHISDINAYDHMLFVTVLCASHPAKFWKRIALLVTAFTIGHSISLALATFEIVKINSSLVEFLIPVTILAACIFNLITANIIHKEEENDIEVLDATEIVEQQSKDAKIFVILQYLIILIFGIIHGLGFSNYIKMMLMNSESIFTPLLAFNIGLELGQLIIVAIVLSISYLAVNRLRLPGRIWTILVSSFAALIAMKLTVETATAYFYG